jgi:hypothetical protein
MTPFGRTASLDGQREVHPLWIGRRAWVSKRSGKSRGVLWWTDGVSVVITLDGVPGVVVLAADSRGTCWDFLRSS